ncbi:MAG: hypothetical protein EOO77_26445 [Oxalobacteraceae bacterium]|nr:MAG: hypothetical protein EOO77_26445 [Oxalobacteraceae bacterium]
MTISITGSSSPFLKQLETNGLTASKATLVEKDLSAAQTATTSASSTTISPATRAAFDAKISADVLSGKLSASDAASVRNTMDNLGGGSASSTDTSQSASTGTASSQAGANAGAVKTGGGGGGGGGGGSKTELSETVTISGSTMTTVITYTDGTTSTTTTTATDADKAEYDKAATNNTAKGAAAGYQATIDKGAVLNKLA